MKKLNEVSVDSILSTCRISKEPHEPAKLTECGNCFAHEHYLFVLEREVLEGRFKITEFVRNDRMASDVTSNLKGGE